MSNDPKKPVPGSLIIDASDVAVIDITPDQIARLIKVREGVALAMGNVERLSPAEIKRAGVDPEEVARCVSLIAEHRRIGELLPSAEKLVELLYETQLDRAHQISLLFGEICAQARRRAARSHDGAQILGPLQNLLDYQLAPAQKAVVTREKTKAAKGAPGTEPVEPAAKPE